MKKAFLFSILGLVSFLLQAQTNAICQIPLISKSNSIVRMWEIDGIYNQISYLYGGSHDTYLTIKDPSWNYAKVATLPSNTRLNDIQLKSPYNNVSFSCGQQDTTTGFIAYWDNLNFLTAGPAFSCYYSFLPSCSIDISSQIRNIIPEKMVFYDSENIAFVGHGIYENTATGSSFPIRLVGHAVHVVTGWSFTYHIDLDPVEHYDDITLTDHYIVVTSHKYTSEGTFFRIFSRTNFTDPCSNYTYQIANGEADDEVQCTSLGQDNFAIAHFCHDTAGNRKLRVYTIHLASSSPTPIPFSVISMVESLQPVPQGADYLLRDFRYDALKNGLIVLQEQREGQDRSSMLVCYQLDPAFNIVNGYADLYYDKIFFRISHSMDLYPPYRGVFSGTTTDGQFTYVDFHTWMLPPCFNEDILNFIPVTPVPYQELNTKLIIGSRSPESSCILNISVQNVIKKCQ